VKEKKCETVLVFSVITIVLGCFCTPIILYAVNNKPSAGVGLEQIVSEFDVDDCPQQVRNYITA